MIHAFVSAYITYSVQVSILKKKNVGKNLKSTRHKCFFFI